MLYLLVAMLAYLVGSFPSGVVVVRLVRGIDVRRVGSRRSGATNVMRAAGTLAGLAVFLLDVFKGAGMVWLGRWLVSSAWVAERWSAVFRVSPAWPLPPEALSPLWAGLLCGLVCIAGHNWPIYIRFRGGRGVATTLGTLLPQAPLVAVGVFIVGIALIALTRYVSLGSLTGATMVPVGLLVQSFIVPVPLPFILYGLLVGGLIAFQHRDNIVRLVRGTERRLGDPVPVPPPEEPPG